MKRAFLNMAKVSTGLMLALSAPVAWALSVTPPRTELRLSPGEETKAIITVMNPHAEAYNVELSQKPWFVLPENKHIQVQDWLHLPKKQHFKLKPGKSKAIEIRIQCPKDAVGELMAMVSFAYQGEKASMITPMISTAVYLDIEGTEKLLGEIMALGAGIRSGKFQVGAQMKATGNIRLRPAGIIHLLDRKGTAVAEYFLVEGTPIFPGAIRDFATTGPDVPPAPGHYTLSADIRSGTLEMTSTRGFIVDASGALVLDPEAVKP